MSAGERDRIIVRAAGAVLSDNDTAPTSNAILA
jgi:hypothetical protein